MGRFGHEVVKRLLWFVGVVALTYWTPLPVLARKAVDEFTGSEYADGLFKRISTFLSQNPAVIAPAMIGVGSVAILLYCLKVSHFSGLPLLKVTGFPMKSISMVTPKDGGQHIVGAVYIPFENVSNGIGPEAEVKNLSVRVQLRGRRLRWHGEIRLPVHRWGEQKLQAKINLEPLESGSVTILIDHPLKKGTLVPATAENLAPVSVKGIEYGLLDHFEEPLYIAKVTFRGIGVNQVMWFVIWNWSHTDEEPKGHPNSIWGPMNIYKRSLLRLQLLGFPCRPYAPYKPELDKGEKQTTTPESCP